MCANNFIISSCKSDIQNSKHIVAGKSENGKTPLTYSAFKESVQNKRSELKNQPQKEIADFLFSLINDDISTYWKGTPWDFNGTTQTPGEGSIASGYFITNTLTDLGFQLNRVKLAKEPSSKMINLLCTNVKRFSKMEQVEGYLEQQPPNSVCIVGLDFHTGYILKDSTNNYFLHANYIKSKGVMKEKLSDSKALNASSSFMIGSLTSNNPLLAKWVGL